VPVASVIQHRHALPISYVATIMVRPSASCTGISMAPSSVKAVAQHRNDLLGTPRAECHQICVGVIARITGLVLAWPR
jgi:hypothetical protein